MIENRDSMKIKKLIKYYIFGKSMKEIELNRILDKVDNNKGLTNKEIGFLNLYKETKDFNDKNSKDFMYLSKNSTFSKLKELLSEKKKVICDLNDKYGKFGLEIIRVENIFEEDVCTIYMKGDEKHELEDRFLYNIIFNNKKREYSLQEQDEYFEKIEVSNDDDN